MAKSPAKPAAKTAAAPKSAKEAAAQPLAQAQKAPAEKKVPLAKMRGPRGVAETAKITVVSDQNPKRPSSKAFKVFALYKTGMTVGQFCDKVDALDGGEQKGMATPNLVYDSNHGFITIEGYTPANPVTPKPKKEKAEKAPAAPKSAAAVKKGPAKKSAEAKAEVVD